MGIIKLQNKKNIYLVISIAVLFFLSFIYPRVYAMDINVSQMSGNILQQGFMVIAQVDDEENEEEEDGEDEEGDEEDEDEDEEDEEGDEDEDDEEEEIDVDCECVDGELECADEEAEEEAEEYECECDDDDEVVCESEEEEEEIDVDCECSDEELECADDDAETKAEAYGCSCDEDDEISCEGEEFKLGKELFEAYCARCHGFDGDGKGEASNFTYPRPRDFTSGMFKFRSTPSGEPPTDDDLKRTVLGGLAGTSMFGWKGRLSESDVEMIIEYIKTAFAYEAFEFEGEPFEIGDPPQVSAELLKKGEELFQKAKCWECHGKFARGNGEKGWQPNFKDDWGYKIWPTNLNHPWEMRNGPSVKDIFRSITTALDGTPMPSFADAYPEEARWGVAHYIKSLHVTRKLGSKVTFAEVDKIPFSTEDKLWDRVEHLDLKMEGKKVFGMTLISAITNMRVRAVYTKAEIAIMLEWMDKKPDKGDDDFPPDAVRLQFPVRRGVLNIWYWKTSDNSVTEYNADSHNITLLQQKKTDVEIVSSYDDGIYRLIFKRPRDTGDKNDVNFNSSSLIPFSVIAYDGKNMEEGERGARSGVKYMVCKQPAEDSRKSRTRK
jgi:DMSO reductase family type II enzyme heme b subunit